MRRMVSIAVLLAAACANPADEEASKDAGPPRDAGPARDGGDGAERDGGTSEDAGTSCVPEVGDPCFEDDHCNGVVACDGVCAGGTSCDRPPGACFAARGTCEASTATCTYAVRDAAPCNDVDPCTYDDACAGDGTCAGTAIVCDDDLCVDRECNGTNACDETPLTAPVYEVDDGGWDYRLAEPGTIAYRLPPNPDLVTYLLVAPGIGDRLQSLVPNEADTCDWCLCSSPCAFSSTGRTIDVRSTAAAGLVPLDRWIQPSPIRHRSAVAMPSGYVFDAAIGFVCPP